MIMIVMEMVTAMPVNVNAQLIMSMHKIARIMDVSIYCRVFSADVAEKPLDHPVNRCKHFVCSVV